MELKDDSEDEDQWMRERDALKKQIMGSISIKKEDPERAGVLPEAPCGMFFQFFIRRRSTFV